MVGTDLLIGVDAGTSVIKAVAFDLAGRQVGSASVPNRYASGPDGSATQSLAQTWEDCTAALRGLRDKVQNLGARTAAVAAEGMTSPSLTLGYGWTRGLRRLSTGSIPVRSAARASKLPEPASTPVSKEASSRTWIAISVNCLTGRRWLCTARTGSTSA